MIQQLEFTCPECGGHVFEEIMTGVTVCSEITSVEVEDGEIAELQYGEQTNEGGEVDRYQCSECGWWIEERLRADNSAFEIISEEER